MQLEQQKVGTLSVDEFRNGLDSLDQAGWIRLKKGAKYLANGRGIMWEDLLQKALCRSLEGRRNCPRDVDIVTFLFGAMRSIVSAANKASNHDALDTAESIDESEASEEGTSTTLDIPDHKTPDRQIIAQRALTQIEGLFAEDETGLLVLLGQAEGLSPIEIQAEVGLDGKGYATTLKRIRRRIEKFILGENEK